MSDISRSSIARLAKVKDETPHETVSSKAWLNALLATSSIGSVSIIMAALLRSEGSSSLNLICSITLLASQMVLIGPFVYLG